MADRRDAAQDLKEAATPTHLPISFSAAERIEYVYGALYAAFLKCAKNGCGQLSGGLTTDYKGRRLLAIHAVRTNAPSLATSLATFVVKAHEERADVLIETHVVYGSDIICKRIVFQDYSKDSMRRYYHAIHRLMMEGPARVGNSPHKATRACGGTPPSEIRGGRRPGLRVLSSRRKLNF